MNMSEKNQMSRTPIPLQDGRPAFVDATTGRPLAEKPEEMTHLRGNRLVPKQHPRIRFRGMLDSLTAEILCVQQEAFSAGEQALTEHLQEMLEYVRGILGAEVKETALGEICLEGMTGEQLRHASHHIRETAGIDHRIPDYSMGRRALELNRLRTKIRETELAAAEAFADPLKGCTRGDIVQGLNRLSSYAYILSCREAAAQMGIEQALPEEKTAAGHGACGSRLITEKEAAVMLAALPEEVRKIHLDSGAIITPSARDIFLRGRVEVIADE